MRRSYLITSALLFVLALATGVGALKLQYYTHLGPGPGFFAFWLSVFLGVAALAMAADALYKPQAALPADFFPSRDGLRKIGTVVLALVLVIALLEPLGFRLTMLAMYLALLWSLGQRGWVVVPVISLAGSFGLYQLFVQWLGVPLPIGKLGI